MSQLQVGLPVIKPYQGLTSRSSDPLVKKAYSSWRNQRYRCLDSSNKSYPYYGAKGIRVQYSAREFISWWLTEFNKKPWKNPVVGRIDHDKDYCFSNIEMQESSENIKEVHRRLGNRGGAKKRPVCVFFEDKTIVFSSTREAARGLNVHQSKIFRLCSNPSYRQAFKARYMDDVL